MMKSYCADERYPADYIVFMRQAQEANGHVGDWVIERTADAAVVASGTLDKMMSAIGTYPNGRRATWAEDCLRYKSALFYTDFGIDTQFGTMHYIKGAK